MLGPAMPDTRRTDTNQTPNFVYELIERDLAEGRLQPGALRTRFPPEPNGYLHIGHAKAICLNFGAATKYGGTCNLRFDDTNPATEDTEFVEAIERDVHWLGFEWGERRYFASDYFEQLYAWAEQLVQDGKAYVDESTLEQIRERRGDFHRPGEESPYRNRPAAESLDLLRRMRAGEFADGSMVLRAKIDMRAGNINLRDPPMYRILRTPHHRTGDAWCIYPIYDFAHGQSDAIEGITHSVCTLEFEDHRALYDWYLDTLGIDPRPHQYEFSRLDMSYTVLSKRFLRQLVEQNHVHGWDDPRMPTLAGMRRRGFTPEAIRAFCERIGVSKHEGQIEIELFEHIQREDLNRRCSRLMGVLNPLRVVITNYPEDAEEHFDVPNHPEYPDQGSRQVPFSRVVYVEHDDFREDAPKKWHRLAPGREVRLRHACLITCDEVIKNDAGEVIELHCHWDPESRGGNAPDGRKVPGALHWVSARHALSAEARLYERLFTEPDPMAGDGDLFASLNPASLEVVRNCKVEPSCATLDAGAQIQLERQGYFCVDPDSRDGRLVLNRTLALRDGWAKLERKLAG